MELSGPRPLRRIVDTVSKPHIWSRGATAILLENRPTLQVTGSEGLQSFYFNRTVLCRSPRHMIVQIH